MVMGVPPASRQGCMHASNAATDQFEALIIAAPIRRGGAARNTWIFQ
jgi:hypothetical protein